MFDTRPADNKMVDGPAFEAASRVVGAGKLTVSATTRVVTGVRALICFYLAFMFAIGTLSAIATSNSLSQLLMGLVLGGGVVVGCTCTGVRLLRS